MRTETPRRIGKSHTPSVTERQIGEEQRRERLGSPNALGLCKEPTPKRLVLKVRIKGKWLDAWIDCGAKRNFIDPKVVTRLKLPWRKKKDAYPLINAEGQLFDYN